MKPGDEFLKVVQWSMEDGCYVGACPGVLRGGVHGDDETAVYKELCEVVAETIELYKSDARPLPKPTASRAYSGRFVLRVEKELHQALAVRAIQQGESLNSYCRRILKKAA
jgi:predicted RNase H-like HicB family nuclease